MDMGDSMQAVTLNIIFFVQRSESLHVRLTLYQLLAPCGGRSLPKLSLPGKEGLSRAGWAAALPGGTFQMREGL